MRTLHLSWSADTKPALCVYFRSAVFDLEGRLAAAVHEADEQQREQQAAAEEKDALIAGLEAAHREETASLTQDCARKVSRVRHFLSEALLPLVFRKLVLKVWGSGLCDQEIECGS